MAKLPEAFKAGSHDSMNDYSVIAAGDYIGQIIKSEMKKCGEKAKDPKGSYISLQIKLLNSSAKGKLIFTNLNIINKNPAAVEMANKELATICKACGKLSVNDTEELHGIPMKLKVGIDKGSNGHPDQNRIDFYDKLDGNSVPEESSEEGGEPKKKKMPWE